MAHVAARRRAARFRRGLPVSPRPDLLTIGDPGYGGYVIPANLLRPEGVCLNAGVGTDITFDLLLIARFGCTVHAVDPVPAAADYVAAAAAREPRLVFHPVALWDRDEELTFHAPRVDGFVSHSATDLHGTAAAFRAEARSPRSLMKEWEVPRLDLLKLSVEGAEYRIVDHVLAERLPVGVLCVEYAQPAPAERALGSVDKLISAGWQLVAAGVAPWGWKLTFVAPDAVAPGPQSRVAIAT